MSKLTVIPASEEAPASEDDLRWPSEGATRVPTWIYTDQAVFDREMERIFQGPTWHLVAMECEIPEPTSWVRSHVGDQSVVVTRDKDGEVHVVTNRCTHRGAPLCWKDRGKSKGLLCPYHSWNFSLSGDLRSVAFERGYDGAGGMPETFDKADHGLTKLRAAVRGGAVWATFSPEAPTFEDYVGEDILAAMDRSFAGREPVLLGSSRHVLECNWKMWFENARDPYHATILHAFFTTFGLFRADLPPAQTKVFDQGHYLTSTFLAPFDHDVDDQVEAEMRTFKSGLELNEPITARSVCDEYGDNRNIALQVFPASMWIQHLNTPSFRRIIPISPNRMEMVWTFYGFADDTAELREARLKQANLVGPAGYVTSEDGEVIEKSQPLFDAAPELPQVLEMGGSSTGTPANMLSENLGRSYYAAWRRLMGI
jgi:anthranilate 1,2-dioxygenase large subunit